MRGVTLLVAIGLLVLGGCKDDKLCKGDDCEPSQVPMPRPSALQKPGELERPPSAVVVPADLRPPR